MNSDMPNPAGNSGSTSMLPNADPSAKQPNQNLSAAQFSGGSGSGVPAAATLGNQVGNAGTGV